MQLGSGNQPGFAGLNHQLHLPWSQRKGFTAYPQPAGPVLVNTSFPAPSPFLQETPLLPQLGRYFSAYTLEPTTQALGGGGQGANPDPVSVSTARSTWLAFLYSEAKPSDTRETRAGSAGQHTGFLSKCLRLGFLLAEGWPAALL